MNYPDYTIPENMWKSLSAGLNFILPNRCFHCSERIKTEHHFLCYACYRQMKKYNPATDFQKVLDTRLAGRLKTDYRWVSFWFGKESPIQTLIHELKYNYRPRIGSWLGDNLGNMITVTPGLPDFHLIPVPVHPLKKIERGYNQAELIAASMVNCLPGCQMIPDLVVKKSQTSSQTKLDRWTRFMNSKDTLELNLNHPILKLQNPHFLLVDDIITTGSTLENMGKLLQTALPQATFSVAAIALTE